MPVDGDTAGTVGGMATSLVSGELPATQTQKPVTPHKFPGGEIYSQNHLDDRIGDAILNDAEAVAATYGPDAVVVYGDDDGGGVDTNGGTIESLPDEPTVEDTAIRYVDPTGGPRQRLLRQ